MLWPYDNLPAAALTVIDEVADHLAFRLWQPIGSPTASAQRLREEIRAEVADRHLAAGLDLEDQLWLAERYATHEGVESVDEWPQDLRRWIREQASECIHHLAEQRVLASLSALEAFMAEHGFDIDDLYRESGFDDQAHRGERRISDLCRVLEIRDLPGYRDADLWEYRLAPSRTVYLLRKLSRRS